MQRASCQRPGAYALRVEIGAAYVAAQRSFCSLFESLTDRDRATTVPCTPGWSVRDVLSHVAGVADDIVHGRVEGAASQPWTAAQVARWRDADWRDLVARWDEQTPQVASLLQHLGEQRPPLDCHSHEHDVRHAVGRPGNRDSDLIGWMGALFVAAPIGRPVEVRDHGRAWATIDGAAHVDPVTLVVDGVDGFELVRSRLGRRSQAQVESYRWSAPPTAAELAAWFVFGPSAEPIDE